MTMTGRSSTGQNHCDKEPTAQHALRCWVQDQRSHASTVEFTCPSDRARSRNGAVPRQRAVCSASQDPSLAGTPPLHCPRRPQQELSKQERRDTVAASSYVSTNRTPAWCDTNEAQLSRTGSQALGHRPEPRRSQRHRPSRLALDAVCYAAPSMADLWDQPSSH